jgi:hypothetical protein
VFNSLIEAMLGKTGTNLLVRLSSVILLCIGIEIIWSGTSNLIGSLRSRCGAAGGSLVPAVAGSFFDPYAIYRNLPSAALT